MSPSPTIRVAAAQVEPIWGDLEATVAKTLEIIRDAAGKGVKVLALPELWIPGYPFWIWSLPALQWQPQWSSYIENSLSVDSPQMMLIRQCCAANKLWVHLGFSEREGSSLYMSTCWINDKGDVASHRRKIMPTGTERVIFGNSSGDSVKNVIPSPHGRLGSLMCWEHTQPLLRYHTASQYEQIHVGSWPYLFPVLGEDMHWGMTRDGCLNLSQAFAAEAGTFVLVTTTPMSQAGALRMGITDEVLVRSPFQVPGGGGSRIFGPDGRLLAGGDMDPGQEGVVICDIDLRDILKAKTLLDGVGHYSRPDIFSLHVNSSLNRCVNYVSHILSQNAPTAHSRCIPLECSSPIDADETIGCASASEEGSEVVV